jgi:hypothetical protein
MGKRQLTRADDELIREVETMLAPGEEPPSPTQLERWRQAGLIPETDSAGGRSTRYPAGTAQQAVALVRDPRRVGVLDKTVLPLFFAGYRVSGDAVRRAMIAELARVRTRLERYAGTRKSRYQATPQPQLTAARLAEKLARGRLSAQSRRQTNLMLAHLRQPLRWIPDDSPESNLQTVYTCLFYLFLAGRLLPGSIDVFYEALVAYGFEAALTDLVSADIAKAAAQYATTDESVPRLLPRLSLPGLAKELAAMDTADFERAREDCFQVVDLCLFFFRAIIALLSPNVVGAMPWSLYEGVDWRFVASVAALPLLFYARRNDAKALDVLLEIAREQLPKWKANFESDLTAGVFADEAKREAIRANVFREIKNTLAGA